MKARRVDGVDMMYTSYREFETKTGTEMGEDDGGLGFVRSSSRPKEAPPRDTLKP